MPSTYGYARVSGTDQDLSLQVDRLEAAGCSVVRAEKITGTKRAGRVELETLLSFLQPGDTLMVTRIDRLARSLGDLQDIVRDLQSKGVALKATDQSVDTTPAAGKAFLDMLSVFAEFETNLRRERQMEGIAKAKAEDKLRPQGERKYGGRKPSVDRAEVRRLRAEGLGAAAIAKQLGIGRASVYRALD